MRVAERDLRPGHALPEGMDIRIHSREYTGIVPEGGEVVHFNLSPAYHAVGGCYVLSRILVPGIDGPDGERLPPVLDHADCFVGTCIGFVTRLDYADLVDNHFRGSMRHIRSREDVAREILVRYRRSRPHLGETDILAAGVSLTRLKVIGRTDAAGAYVPGR